MHRANIASYLGDLPASKRKSHHLDAYKADIKVV